MNIYIISDTHFNHHNIKTYCQRPENYNELLIRNWRNTVRPEDLVLHLGDVFIGKPDGWDLIWPQLTGRKVLVPGNHDRKRSNSWWMTHGFDFACETMIFRRCLLTHEPAQALPARCDFNIHGHLHNIWHGFHKNDPEANFAHTYRKLNNPWQRLFAVEYCDYRPIEFEKFLANKDNRYQSVGPRS